MAKALIKLTSCCRSAPARTGKNIWYFSYGSNMSEEVFAKRRQITAQQSKPCTIPNYILSYQLNGFPFMEPCFATCMKREHSSYPFERPDVQGMAFLITESEFKRVLATEGGSGWNDGSCGGYRISTVEAVDYDDNKFTVVTLTNVPADFNTRINSWKNCPSQRYKNLVVNGAKKSGVDSKYIEFLEKQDIYDRSKNGCGQKLAIAIQILFFLPTILFMVFGNGLFLKCLKFDRSPWIIVRILYLYRKAINCILHPILFLCCGNGYNNSGYNNSDDDENENDDNSEIKKL